MITSSSSSISSTFSISSSSASSSVPSSVSSAVSSDVSSVVSSAVSSDVSSIVSSAVSSDVSSIVSSAVSSDVSSVISSIHSSSVFSDASPGASSFVVQITGNPEITVDVSYNGVVDLIHLTALNNDLNYIEGSETFYGNGEVLTNTKIAVVDGEFDATAVLGSQLDDISFVATADNSGKTTYPITVSAEFTYEAVATPFYPLETGVAEKKKLIKRAAFDSYLYYH
ncbi:unnamed protein product [Ambrosiozyma monospora]|uniref:Unnamed protein product n=1 Tax=Ambrosiozyma monospora TaxID=43982 RepID=A0ACB5U8B3_AMBMO|nr:unnamed protein product [Ambrosiozyma monospora]